VAETHDACVEGAKAAGRAREDLEAMGLEVVTADNFLPKPPEKKGLPPTAAKGKRKK
jgi:hypothetical protein